MEWAIAGLGKAVAWVFGDFWRMLFFAAMLFAGVMFLQNVWLSDDLEEAQIALQKAQNDARTALSANAANVAVIEKLRENRDSLLAARAAEREEAAALQEMADILQARADRQIQNQRKKIDDLSRQVACQTAMLAPVCPEIERVLRAP